MKKIAFVFCLFMLSAAAFADAQKRITGFDVSVPLETRTWHLSDSGENCGNASVFYNGADINLYRMTVEKNGFSVIYSAGAGKTKLQLENSLEVSGYDLNAKFGFGHAFFNTDDLVLALHAFIGGGVKYAGGPESGIDVKAVEFRIPAGADVSFVHRIAEHFSVCAGLDLSVNFAGFGAFSIETSEGSTSKAYDIDYMFSGISAVPYFGFCWIF